MSLKPKVEREAVEDLGQGLPDTRNLRLLTFGGHGKTKVVGEWWRVEGQEERGVRQRDRGSSKSER